MKIERIIITLEDGQRIDVLPDGDVAPYSGWRNVDDALQAAAELLRRVADRETCAALNG